MQGLILEGGTFRPIFSAGIMDALLDNDIMFPYCIGVSAGITNAFSYISKQKRRNLNILETYRNDKRYLSMRNFIKCKSIFGLDFVFDELPNKLDIFDQKTFDTYKGKLLVGVTNANTGEEEYLNGMELDKKCTMLRATCAIPILFPAIEIGENQYFDGGLCDPIPIKKALDDGVSKFLILLTRPKGFKLIQKKKNLLVSRIVKKKYPNIVSALKTRHIKYNETVALCEKLEKEGRAVILRPSSDQAIESFEKDINKLKKGYLDGYNLASSKIDKIKKLFEI